MIYVCRILLKLDNTLLPAQFICTTIAQWKSFKTAQYHNNKHMKRMPTITQSDLVEAEDWECGQGCWPWLQTKLYKTKQKKQARQS